MRNECLNLIGDGAFLKEEKLKTTREKIYKELQYMMYLHLLNDGIGKDKATRISNIYAVKNTNKEYYKRIKQ